MTGFEHAALPVRLAPVASTGSILSRTLGHMQSAPSSLMVWSGPPGHGKTIASEQFKERLVALRPAHTTPVAMMNWGGALHGTGTRQMHRGLSTVYKRFVEDASPRFLGRLSEQCLAEDIATAFHDSGTILLIIDEAGTMSADEMRGVGMIVDAAAQLAYRIHILMISMDNITPKLTAHRVIESRTTLDCDFGAWASSDMVRLLQTCGHALATALAREPESAAALGEDLVRDSRGDLRLVLTVGLRMNAVLAKPQPRPAAIDLQQLAEVLLAAHRAARRERASREPDAPTRRRRRQSA